MKTVRIGLLVGRAYRIIGRLHLFFPYDAGGYYDPALHYVSAALAYRNNPLPFTCKFVMLPS